MRKVCDVRFFSKEKAQAFAETVHNPTIRVKTLSGGITCYDVLYFNGDGKQDGKID